MNLESLKKRKQGESVTPRRPSLVLPGQIKWATTAEAITSPNYEPATSGAGLPQIGGMSDWWDKPEHFRDGGKQFEYQGFAAQEKITDPRLLKVILRRALVEGLALKKFGANPKNPASIAAVIGNGDHWERTVSVEMCRGEDGELALKNDSDLQKVWILMRNAAEKAEYTRMWTEEVKRLRKAKERKQAKQLLEEGEKLGYVFDSEEGSQVKLTVPYAVKLRQTWNNDWKEATIRDPVVKFYVRHPVVPNHITTRDKIANRNLSQFNRPPSASRK